jgi:hypothetical protein
MDPIGSMLTGHISGKALDRIGDLFRVHVIERWSRYRAGQFLDQLCMEVQREENGGKSQGLMLLIENILDDEIATKVIFDAYRRVTLSRFKTLGPRVIAILTARFLAEERTADASEEVMMDAVQSLYDDELKEFASFVHSYMQDAIEPRKKDVSLAKNGEIKISWHSEQIDSNWKHEAAISVSPLNLNEAIGAWAKKVEAVGIFSTEVTERHWDYREDSDRHIDQDGSVRECKCHTAERPPASPILNRHKLLAAR